VLIMNSTVNTKQYEKNRNGVKARFFDTLEKFGGEMLRPLMLFAMDGFKKNRLFYIKLRGEKMQEKRFILNQCLLLIALKWRNGRGATKNYGKHLQPSTWETKLKYLFSVFRKKNIQYNYATDFNGDGEFHAVLAAQWGKERSLDPTFASRVGTSTIDMEADQKLHEKFSAGEFNPFSTNVTAEAYEHRRKYLIYVLGRFFLLRGRNEIAYCTWSQIKFSESACNGIKEEFVEVTHQWDKSHQCKL